MKKNVKRKINTETKSVLMMDYFDDKERPNKIKVNGKEIKNAEFNHPETLFGTPNWRALSIPKTEEEIKEVEFIY